MVKAVLFDMDDVLVDTEAVDHTVALTICHELGLTLTPEEEASRMGIKTTEFYEKLSERHSLPMPIAEIVAKHFEMYEKELTENLKTLPGAKEVPRSLKSEGYKLALVSGSTRTQINIILSQLNLESVFDTVVAAEDVKRGKPAPEGYLLAAQKLGVTPEECVVIEDAPPGIAAGKAGGMKVIAVKTKHGHDISRANMQIESLVQLPTVI